MTDPVQGEGMPAAAPLQCPWCSATLDSADAARCPSCNAILRESTGSEVPGVTSVDLDAVLRSRKPPSRQSGFIGWLSGSYQEAPGPEAERSEVSPPDEDVKREMVRMEIAAIEARMEAERLELAAERAAELGRGVDAPPSVPSAGPDAAESGDPARETDGPA
ncbi:MAG: hypothetical protein EPO00_06745 [Chloroflexota bacterium]|nr:MAG: hypothetical protein EPO00_06745 [Chloroflexota bacterium]